MAVIATYTCPVLATPLGATAPPAYRGGLLFLALIALRELLLVSQFADESALGKENIRVLLHCAENCRANAKSIFSRRVAPTVFSLFSS